MKTNNSSRKVSNSTRSNARVNRFNSHSEYEKPKKVRSQIIKAVRDTPGGIFHVAMEDPRIR